MHNLPLPKKACISPKRKRENQESLPSTAPSPSRLRTADLPSRPILAEDHGSEGSPRTSVAGHLQDLDLEEQNQLPNLDFGRPYEPQSHNLETTPGPTGFHPQITLPGPKYSRLSTVPESSDGTHVVTTEPGFTQTLRAPLEIPDSPPLRPISSPTPPSMTKSRSPPPQSLLWWSDMEITGHNPSDPTDDGYGINGVGFLPTPAIANARAERRKRQLADWKSREAKEARQKRGDRRRRRDIETRAMSNESENDESEMKVDGYRKVRFLEA